MKEWHTDWTDATDFTDFLFGFNGTRIGRMRLILLIFFVVKCFKIKKSVSWYESVSGFFLECTPQYF